MQGRTEHRQGLVADEFVDESAATVDHIHHDAEEVVEDRENLFGVAVRGHGR
ncbi:Uncharacterised protein [Mycobacteroides abscessus subsp. abscessus]|nr:Uncharacterised protein [Mycobacteroides abscessus subsp. abscessus]